MAHTDGDTALRMRRLLVVAIAAAITLLADLSSKAWAWHELRPHPHPPRMPIPGVLHFAFSLNTGAAFGMLRDASWSRHLLVAVAVAVVAYLGRLAWRWPGRAWLAAVGIGLLMGGALGNLHDRLTRGVKVYGEGVRHGVVDFIVVYYWPGRPWPAFNLADVALLLGMIVVAWSLWQHRAALAR